ncbi:MAG: hypothetical protein IJM69_04400 [Firmicutes bacterium]|nr:hypothetical protein [Bacillota bacterium]
MSSANSAMEAFKLNYEKFLVACDAVEKDGLWNTEEDGEMEAWFANDVSCAIVRLIASDGVFRQKEVDLLNDALGFAYTVEELEAVYDDYSEKIDVLFEEELPASIEQLEELNPELADDYRSMMRLICDVIIEADETVTEREKEDAEHLKALL